jgi:hypothetical protein
MAIKVTSKSEITVQKVIPLGPNASDRVTNRGANTTKLKYSEKSPVPMRDSAHFSQVLSGGAASVDLLALPATNAPTPATAGMKVQIIKVQNPNPNPLTVKPAATNGYPLSFTVPPKSFAHFEHENSLPPIEHNCHLLTVAGEGSETSVWTIVVG